MSGIYFSKFPAVFVFILITLLPTLIYVFSISQLANPPGNIDLNAIAASYFSLILLVMVFVSIGLFGSSVSGNQVISLIISVVLCLFCFYGFDLLTGIFLSGKLQSAVSLLGLLHHYESMQRGVIQLKDLLTIANYLVIFILFCFIFLENRHIRVGVKYILCLFVLNIVFYFIPDYQVDFTSDKRYTLSDYTIGLLKNQKERTAVNVEIYLTGDLNYGFQRLQDATVDLLNDYNRYASNDLNIIFANTYQSDNSISDIYEQMSAKGMPGIILNEMDREGKASRKVVYPYARISDGKDTLVVPLLKNIAGYTAGENINASVESLEFEFTDAIRLLEQDSFKTVAFIEGHNEIPRTYVYDAEELLSKYYFVNRGKIGNDAGILDDFEAVIVAGPLSGYNEAEKYILDQYIMSGGKVLWLVDGAFYSHQDLARLGYSASMKNDVNLDDMLFSYGVRINPDLIQDRQCVSTYLMSDGEAQPASMIPSYFQPLLIPSRDSPVTKNIRDVKAGFAGSIDVVNNSPDIRKNILLTTSSDTHLVKVPEVIDFDITKVQDDPDYFNQQFVPVAISLEGEFPSVFRNRMIPDSVRTAGRKIMDKSKSTKMIVVSSSDIISNEIQGQGQNSRVLPMGYDRVSQQQFGNRDFIVNAVNWLTDDDGLMQLRTKQQKLYILNKKEAYESKNKYAVINTGLPALLMLSVMGTIVLYRKRKYEK
jgi:ABC-2 type transport system permease protein